MRRGTRSAIIGGAVAAILLTAGPASASLASVGSRDGGQQLQVSGGPGENNDIHVGRSGTSYVITDPAGIIAGPGCMGGGTMVTCPDPSGSIVRAVVAPADGDDRVILLITLPSLLNGGPGRDQLHGGTARDRMIGGGDVDVLLGLAGPDRLMGGALGDRLVGGSESDVLRGEQGPDELRARDGDRDTVGGGPGSDRAKVDRKDRVKNDVEQVA
jgi:Ca2+-binding RTX toxin-like protein